MRYLVIVVVLASMVLVACGSENPAATPTAGAPSGTTNLFAAVPGIVEPTNFGWPRTVDTANGRITLEGPAQRIHSLSLGHTEIVAALVGVERFASVYTLTADPIYSNIAGLVGDVQQVSGDPEAIIGTRPDLVFASKFTQQTLIDALQAARVPVARTDLEDSAIGNAANILLMGYMLGAEDRAVEMVEEIQDRMRRVGDETPDAESEKVRALAVADFSGLYAAGSGSTEGGIIEAAGGINAAAASGIDSHQVISLESIVQISPDVILITQPNPGADELAARLKAEPALGEVPAVREGRVYFAEPRYFTTLSHWNVRGVEEAAKLFYPDRFDDAQFRDFEPYTP